ncbi:protein split ends isoform X4 [Rhizophagus clarus]|uniref:Protein split ends isoform X4 n=1 Tax=Rhizophagus clarus TaxID=94130 RepID=A0A8H3QX04_9GLOM|nr:protein split ends isoform X4 [Rhizophagus clarus]GES95268.1 protein split ends isoform X4 [Rhizophagus clarus]
MTKRRGVTEKDKATKAAKTTKTIRTYVANSSRDYNKERDERREEGSEHEQDNLHGQDVDIGEDMLPEQEERNIEKERRENEKKEMERRDKERREKERREKERREKERRERDRREKDKEQEENENDESESEEEIPVQFGAMTNQLQICNWLVLHPSVLHLANKMLDASTKQPSTNLPLTTSTSSPSDNDNYRLIDEEMKCLFLRTRNPPDHAFDKITQKIFGHDAYQSVAKSINERYHKSFSDYRYQLKNVLSTLVKEFRQIVESGYTESSDPTDEEVNNFISREVVLKRILSRYVSAIDFTKLSETSLDKLIEFSRKCFKIVWVETESANIKEKVKELDVITEDLEIPSRSGRNIASSLKLHLFS